MSKYNKNWRAIDDQKAWDLATKPRKFPSWKKTETPKEYAPPALEVKDGVMSDKSQDADWLRARYFEGTALIEKLEADLRSARALLDAHDLLEQLL